MKYVVPTLGVLLCVLAGCNDRRLELQIVPTTEVIEDVGPDVEVFVDPRCTDVPEGSPCDVVAGAGICAIGQCRIVACAQGFSDCNQDPDDGCEGDLRGPERCGTCTGSCAEHETCQLGVAGYVCSAGTICPADTYDIDGRDGCELEVSWLSTVDIVPFDHEVGATLVEADSTVVAAGVVAGQPTWMRGVRFESFAGIEPAAVGIAALADGTRFGLLWPGSLVWTSDVGEAPVVEVDSCANSARYVDVLAADGWTVATSRDVLRYDNSETPGLLARIGPAEYLTAFRPNSADPDPRARAVQLTDAEFALCDTCIFDASPPGQLSVDAACVSTACQTSAPADCGVCTTLDASTCPDFRPQKVAASRDDPSRLYVLTARGVVVAYDDRLVYRIEQAYDPAVVVGRRFLDMRVDTVDSTTDAVTLVGAQGDIVVLDVSWTAARVATHSPAVPVARLELDVSQWTGIGGFSSTFVAADRERVVVASYASGTTRAATLALDALGNEFQILGVDSQSVFIASFGQITVARIHEPESDDGGR